jgi:hypothetical protein
MLMQGDDFAMLGAGAFGRVKRTLAKQAARVARKKKPKLLNKISKRFIRENKQRRGKVALRQALSKDAGFSSRAQNAMQYLTRS